MGLLKSPTEGSAQMAYLAYSSASLLLACNTLNAKGSGFGGNFILSPGQSRALCLVTDLWKFLLGFFPVW